VVFVLAALGGLFWPLYDLPRWMQTAANGAVTTWSMFAIQDVILRDRGVAEVSSKLLILYAYGLVCFLIGLRLFRYGDGARS
jgi:ABC-2 type transport system permease protein